MACGHTNELKFAFAQNTYNCCVDFGFNITSLSIHIYCMNTDDSCCIRQFRVMITGPGSFIYFFLLTVVAYLNGHWNDIPKYHV